MLNKNNELNDENLSNVSGGYESGSSIDEQLNQMMEFIEQLGGADPSFEQRSKLTPMQRATLKQYQQQLSEILYQYRANNGKNSQYTLKKIKHVADNINKYLG